MHGRHLPANVLECPEVLQHLKSVVVLSKSNIFLSHQRSAPGQILEITNIELIAKIKCL